MIQIATSEELIPIRRAAEIVGRNRRTLLRWSSPPGFRGVRLATTRVGRGVYTTTEALQAFCDSVNQLPAEEHLIASLAVANERLAEMREAAE